jgi:drug/metabolite transporter (DMT)-like permease
VFDWKILAFSVPLLFASYQALAKFLPKDVSVFLINAYASFIGVILMLSLHLLTQPSKSLTLSSKNLLLAIGIGLLIGLGNYGILKAYSLGAPQTLFTIFFYITLIVYGTILGLLVFNEKLNLAQVVGAVLTCVGIFIIVYFKK